jgi:hypothetical protein
MKKKILYIFFIFLASSIIFLNIESIRYTGINYSLTTEKITNLQKITDFFERYNNYKKVVKKINSNSDKEKDNKIINTANWVYSNIKKISDGDNIIDSHPWTIIERKIGVSDQFSDVLSVLLVFNNIDSFFRSTFNGKGHSLTFFKDKNDWSLIDPYYGIYFLNNKNQFCNLKEHKSKKCFFFHLEYEIIKKDNLNKIFFDKNFKDLNEFKNYYNLLFENIPSSKEIDNINIYERGGRSYVQKPFHRFVYQIQKSLNLID